MSRWCFVIAIIIVLLVGCSRQSTLLDNNGQAIRLADYHGKWIILHYWASWCKVCTEEIPEINNFYNAHKDKDAIVLGVNYDQIDQQQLPGLVQRMGIMFPNLMSDPTMQLGIAPLPGLPGNVLIGPDGKLKEILLGEQTQQSLERVIQSL